MFHDTAHTPKRRILRFTLRSLLLLMLIVCIALGWKVERARKQREAVIWIRSMGGSVAYEYQRDNRGHRITNAEPPVPKWLVKQLGIDLFDEVVYVELVDAKQVGDVSRLAWLTSLEELSLYRTPVSDLKPLSDLKRLEVLGISDTQVRDLTPLSGLTNLKRLYFWGTQVNDVTPLSSLVNLEHLDLWDRKVHDVTPFFGLTNLRSLHLKRKHVTKEEFAMLREALPRCLIH